MTKREAEAIRIIRRLVRDFWGECGTGVAYMQHKPRRSLMDADKFLMKYGGV